MMKDLRVSLFDLTSCLSNIMDMVDPNLVDHHRKVAYISIRLAKELDMSIKQQQDLMMASILHDIGALSVVDKLQALKFDFENPHKHSYQGYALLKMYDPFAEIASIVRFHHVPWTQGGGAQFEGQTVPLSSHILHLADRIAISIDKDQEILTQASAIRNRIEKNIEEQFLPEAVNAFRSLAQKEYFWCDVASPEIGMILNTLLIMPTIEMDMPSLLTLIQVLAHIVDFRSKFSATHSSGVAAASSSLAKFAGFTKTECAMMGVAGYLHDIGKLAVPAEILEKREKLTEADFNIIRRHPYATYHALENIGGFDTINAWASYHHERINGNGYPFHLKGDHISLGSRIMSVADIFTAITEERPYRKGMTDDAAVQVLQEMAENCFLDGELVVLLKEHFNEINLSRGMAQAAAFEAYQQFNKSLPYIAGPRQNN